MIYYQLVRQDNIHAGDNRNVQKAIKKTKTQ
jgi:hypothetical protein